MTAAIARYDRLTDMSRHVTVSYDPSVQTADANSNGNMRFGADRQYMTEGTALHELAHTFGVGTTWSWDLLCFNGTYRGEKANALVRSWDGADATIACDRWHFWPYGLNYSSEYTERNLDRNVLVVQAMREDGVRFD